MLSSFVQQGERSAALRSASRSVIPAVLRSVGAGIQQVLVVLFVSFWLTPPAQAQFAVIDVASVTQLISEVKTLEQQLATARLELAQVRTAYSSTVGSRGMQLLLSGTTRNYLPSNWTTVQSAAQGQSSAFSSLSADISSATKANVVLSASQLALMSTAASKQVQSQRQTVAVLQALAHQGLANASGRFSSLQQLINALGSATDQKAVLDLQARISAEVSMLQNESTKLQVLYQSAQADRWADEQRSRELAVAGQGAFSSRFQPTP